MVLVYSPDRLARKFAYQALLLEEFARRPGSGWISSRARAATPRKTSCWSSSRRIFAEYEKAQLAERYRRGKAHRAAAGSVNVLSAPRSATGTSPQDRPVRCRLRGPRARGGSAEMFRRYADGGAAIADLARWLTGLGVPTRTGKNRWDRSVVWPMLRNPAYAGRAVFETMATSGRQG